MKDAGPRGQDCTIRLKGRCEREIEPEPWPCWRYSDHSYLSEASPASPQDATTNEVRLSQSVGPPDGIVAVPIHVAAATGVQIGAFTLRLRFPARRLTFTKVEMGGLGEGVGAEAKTASTESEGETLLSVTIATPEQQGVRTPIPDGPVAQLMFKIAKDLKPETVIRLAVSVDGIGIEAGAAALKFTARDGQIIVSIPPVISCFFYMH